MAQRAGTEAAPAGGGGSNELTQEQFLEAARKLADWNAKKAEVNAGRNGYRKQLKAQGVELGKLDTILKMAEWDRQEVRDHFAILDRYAIWMGLPVGAQAELFGADDHEKRAREWHGAGMTARRAGKTKAAPQQVGEKYLPFWDAGYMLKEFVWEGSAAPAGKVEPDGGKAPAAPAASGKPGAAAGKRSAGRAKKVAGMISPPPVVSGGDTVAAAGDEAGAGAGDTVQAAGGDDRPADDGFGKTGFAVH